MAVVTWFFGGEGRSFGKMHTHIRPVRTGIILDPCSNQEAITHLKRALVVAEMREIIATEMVDGGLFKRVIRNNFGK